MQLDIDCADPEALAAFWAEALDYRVADPPLDHPTWKAFGEAEANEPGEAWCKAVDPDGSGPPVLFHRVPEPKAVKNRLHVDVLVPPHDGDGRGTRLDVEAEAERLGGLGASRIHDRFEDGHCFIVMADPEGNEFCIAA